MYCVISIEHDEFFITFQFEIEYQSTFIKSDTLSFLQYFVTQNFKLQDSGGFRYSRGDQSSIKKIKTIGQYIISVNEKYNLDERDRLHLTDFN